MGCRGAKRKVVNWRTIASLLTTWMFLVAGVSGLVLYVVPQGRIAYWVDWRLLGLTKTDWGNIHIVATVVFLVAGGWHLYFNWQAFLSHLRRRLGDDLRLRRELAITAAVALVIVFAALLRVPPLGYLIDLNDHIKDSWIESPDVEPPFGHAELLSLEKLCRKTGIDPELARAELAGRGYGVVSGSQTLEQIAERNGVSPRDVFAAIEKFQTRHGVHRGRSGGRGRKAAGAMPGKSAGQHLGRKRISEACESGGQETDRCIERLRALGIEAAPNEKIRAVAERVGKRPSRLLQMMLLEEER